MLELRSAFWESQRRETLELLFICRRTKLNKQFERLEPKDAETQGFSQPNTDTFVDAVLQGLRLKVTTALDRDDQDSLNQSLEDYTTYLDSFETVSEADSNFIVANADKVMRKGLRSKSAGGGEDLDPIAASAIKCLMYMVQMHLICDSVRLFDAVTAAHRANSTLKILLKCVRASSLICNDRSTICQVVCPVMLGADYNKPGSRKSRWRKKPLLGVCGNDLRLY